MSSGIIALQGGEDANRLSKTFFGERLTEAQAVAYDVTMNANELITAAANARNTLDNVRLEVAQKLANARNYSFEAYMSDYSIASLNRADAELQEAKDLALSLGFDPDELVTSDGGTWRVA